MSRDLQQSKVYSAEQQMSNLLDTSATMGITTVEIAGSNLVVPIERKFGDLEAVQTYVNAVMAEIHDDYPRVPKRVTVRARKGNGRAHYERLGSKIAMPPHHGWERSWAMREMVVLHELAHHLTRDADQCHGPEFVAAMIDLLHRFMGVEAAFMLRLLAHESGVKVG